ncbi:MAG: hypothetical protein IPF92_24510 [Myxococcales bacterium]|nr:hypothetical protein [Myxococcales bacterium]
MRDKVVPFVLLAALAGLGVLAAVRTKPPHDAPLVRVQEEGDASGDASALDAAALDAAARDAAVAADPADAVAAPASDGAPPTQVVKLLDRPLRVTTLGAALAAPGTMAFAPGATRPFELELCPVESLAKVEGRLVRGGADADGADIAIVALPDLVAATERLRALEPQAFLLVGFSQAAERLVPLAAPGASRAPAATGEVKVFVPAGERLASRQWMALFALDAAGASPSRVKFVVADERASITHREAAFVAGSFLDKYDGEHLLSTVEAAGLVPYVAITTKHTLTANEPLVRAFSQAWLAGLERAQSDAGGAAKRVLAKEGAVFSTAAELSGELGGVVERLGRVSRVTLDDNARLLGASAAAAARRAPLEALSAATVDAYRDAGLLTTAPSWPLVERKVISAIAKDTSPQPTQPPAEKLDCSRSRRRPVATRKEQGPTLDEAALLRRVEVDAVAYEGCALRVSLKGGEKPSATFAQGARDKLGLSAQKVLAGATASPGPALIEVVPPPAP